jgi:ATP adenylyltransferase
MEYILSTQKQGCFLCTALQEEQDEVNLVLKRGESVFIIINRYPYNNGHIMIAPYRHVATLEDMDTNERTEMMDMSAFACERIRKAMKAQGFNIGLNIGEAAGAGLKEHIHLHIVPRWVGDTNFMPVTASTKIIPQDLQSLWVQLNSVFK